MRFLIFVEAVVVGVQDLPGVADVEVVVGPLAPGKVSDPVEVGAGDRVLGAGGGDGLQPVELLLGHLLHLGRQAGLLEPLGQLIELLLLLAQLAQLLLDGLELLAQVVLALRLRHLALHGGVDLVGELEDLPLAVEELEHELHAGLEVHRLQDLLLLLDGDVDVGGDEVGQVPRVGDRLHQLRGGGRELGHELDHLARQLLQVDGEGLDLDVVGRGLLLHRVDPGLQVGGLLHQLQHPEASEPLDHQGVVVLSHFEELHHSCHRTHGVQIGGTRILLLGSPLRDDADHLLVADGVLDEGDGLLAAHRQRKDPAREEDGVSQRQDGQHRRDVLLGDEPGRPHGRGNLRPRSGALLLLFRHADSPLSAREGLRSGIPAGGDVINKKRLNCRAVGVHRRGRNGRQRTPAGKPFPKAGQEPQAPPFASSVFPLHLGPGCAGVPKDHLPTIRPGLRRASAGEKLRGRPAPPPPWQHARPVSKTGPLV